MDIGLGQKTTKESMALDFLSGVILSTPANKELKLNLKLALKNMDEVQFNKVIKEAKQQGVVVNENAVKQVRNYIKDTTEQIKASPELGGIRPKSLGDNAGKNELEDILKAQEIKANKADSDLLSEAKKYKSADEFVKAQGDIVYHGGTVKSAVSYTHLTLPTIYSV